MYLLHIYTPAGARIWPFNKYKTIHTKNWRLCKLSHPALLLCAQDSASLSGCLNASLVCVLLSVHSQVNRGINTQTSLWHTVTSIITGIRITRGKELVPFKGEGSLSSKGLQWKQIPRISLKDENVVARGEKRTCPLCRLGRHREVVEDEVGQQEKTTKKTIYKQHVCHWTSCLGQWYASDRALSTCQHSDG